MKTEDILLIAIIVLLVFILIYRNWGNRSPDQPGLGLSAFLVEVRKELMDAGIKNSSDDSSYGFKISTMDLELNCLVRNSQKDGGEAKIFTVTGSRQSEVSAERVQKIILHLTALPDGKEIVPKPSTPIQADPKGTVKYPDQ